jgi:excisionase family DNA binding protein
MESHAPALTGPVGWPSESAVRHGACVLALSMPNIVEVAAVSENAQSVTLAVTLSDADVERIAQRAAEIVSDRQASSASGWLDTKGAASYMACRPDRIHDLVALGKLNPRRDGRRLLFRRDDLDVYIESSA